MQKYWYLKKMQEKIKNGIYIYFCPQDHNKNSIGVASTIAHEMGHNLGLSHDTENCVCGSSTTKRGCIMSESVGWVRFYTSKKKAAEYS